MNIYLSAEEHARIMDEILLATESGRIATHWIHALELCQWIRKEEPR